MYQGNFETHYAQMLQAKRTHIPSALEECQEMLTTDLDTRAVHREEGADHWEAKRKTKMTQLITVVAQML